jgi:hypothetical protein
MAFFTAGPASIETTYANPAPGDSDETIIRRLEQMIDDAPAGARIRAAVFRLDIESVRDALVRASNRGTVVRVMHNGFDHGEPVAASLSREQPRGLGHGHRWSGQPYDPTGQSHDYGAVATGPGSDLHTKLFLFSSTRDPYGVLRRHVSWWGSANLSRHSGTEKCNNAVAVYDDPVLYDNFRDRLWHHIWNERHFPHNDFYDARSGRGTFRSNASVGCTAYCSPEQTTDLWVNRLRSVVVTSDTELRIAQGRFFDNRAAVADELVRISLSGGSVQVAVGSTPGELGPAIRAKLLQAGIPLRMAQIHDKLMLVRSGYGAVKGIRKLVVNGSHNLTEDGNYVNDELMVKVVNDDLYDDMLSEHFQHIWSIAQPVPA